ncbi:MAG: hypothetical protein QMD85_05170, partial [Candidatus Aenigmarchaeota archaeon]|nr:hypothetical protein [Candidatus Aenigmarchaeota archaeon]
SPAEYSSFNLTINLCQIKVKREDPETRRLQDEKSRQNQKKAVEAWRKLFESDDDFRRRRLEHSRATIIQAARVNWNRYNTDKEYNETLKEKRAQGRRKRWDSDPHYRSHFIEAALRNAKQRAEKNRPRRERLLEILAKEFGTPRGIRFYNVIEALKTGHGDFLAANYMDEGTFHEGRLRNDIKVIKEWQ